jgi:flavin reductase (DIM6/NTAB) family NADH-FMN oxidoreductase RutF
MPLTDSPAGVVTPQTLRHTLAGFATGIAVVAAEVEGQVVGISANSFTSVSLDPPLVSISFDRTSTSWPVLRRAQRWGISVLGENSRDVLAALRRPAHERFTGLEIEVDAGPAFIAGSLATLTVEVDAEVDAGDHVLTLLRVLDLARDDDQFPLVYFGSTAHRLSR